MQSYANEKNDCPSHQLILLTHGIICEIFGAIAHLLAVVEKLSLFELAIEIFVPNVYNFFAMIPVQINHKFMG